MAPLVANLAVFSPSLANPSTPCLVASPTIIAPDLVAYEMVDPMFITVPFRPSEAVF